MGLLRKFRARSVLLALGLAVGVGVPALAVEEYELKGAFLFNFAKYVRWPDSARDGLEAVDVCVAGPSDARQSVSDSLAGKSARGLPVRVRSLPSASAARDCQMVFLTENGDLSLSDVMSVLGGRPVLVVGESPGFAKAGGMINFVVEESKLRFEVNPSAAGRAGLEVSSQLLKLARLVEE